MRRRSFLSLLAGGTLVLPVASVFAAPPYAPPPMLRSILGDEAWIREIGVAYRALRPHEDDAAVLATLLGKGGMLDAGRRARADFEAGRTVRVAGWVLAVTEARECALYTLRTA